MMDVSQAGPIEINEQFQRALDVMEKTDRHVFITGKAGTGKSTLLEYFRSITGKKIAVLAPTGVAALNVKGQTVHSFFRFKPDITPDTVKKIVRKKDNLYSRLDAVIIDEISMVRADLLDCVDRFLRLNGRHPKKSFGGIQMVFIGDLYQLPPVVTSAERELFKSHYDSPYFFSSQVFQKPEFDLEFIELEKIYRQTESDFIGLLNAIRNRSVGEADIGRLNERCDPEFVPPEDDFYITLTSTNDLAAARNREKLKILPGRLHSYRGFIEGEFERSALPTEETLELKAGAQIMMVNNDSKGRWVNGTLGKIVDVSEQKNADDTLLVELQTGEKVEVRPHTWELFRFGYDKESQRIISETVGSFLQYPLRLAWAVTIHKSQGKTFDRVVIDIGRGTFAHGQVYVALSRCTNFRGIVLKKAIRKSHIWMDYSVVRFLTDVQYKKAGEKLPAEERRAAIREAIRRGETLEIVYLKPDDTKSRRTIRPEALEMMEYHGRRFEGLRAFCFKRGDVRHFRLDRILEIAGE